MNNLIEGMILGGNFFNMKSSVFRNPPNVEDHFLITLDILISSGLFLPIRAKKSPFCSLYLIFLALSGIAVNHWDGISWDPPLGS